MQEGGGLRGEVWRDVARCLGDLRSGVEGMHDHFKTAALKDRIPTFDGSGGSTNFNVWLKAMIRTRTLNGLSDEAMKELATLTTKGTCSDFLFRLLDGSHIITWDLLETQLKERYSNSCDTLLARQSLNNVQQEAHESIQAFAEKIMSAAGEAYSKEELRNSVVLQDVLRVFIKGIEDPDIARKLIQKRPKNLDDALREALNMKRNNLAFDITRGTHLVTEQDDHQSEPMDVSQIQGGHWEDTMSEESRWISLGGN